ncbi:DUF6644 family protein [Dawidia cretensis]|uniref:DUF6644 family protein n=1 Tax=Dawidia cretensis TaxID=2782350 RepID=UPI0020B18D3B|nr:DUF6644 family protein [Dawidia cretensis]
MQTDVFEWLEASRLAVFIRQAPLLFPIIEIVHIIGFVFLVGSAFIFDMRLLDLSKRLAVKDVAGYVLPWSRRSMLLVVPSGLLLFISQATALSTNDIFGYKLILIAAAIVNAVIFHRYTLARCEQGASTPPAAKAAAVISLLLWTSVITCGRLIAYF